VTETAEETLAAVLRGPVLSVRFSLSVSANGQRLWIRREGVGGSLVMRSAGYLAWSVRSLLPVWKTG